jgi:hypothetical protein
MRRLALCIFIFPALMLAATQVEDWKTGKVTDQLTTWGEGASGNTAGGSHQLQVDTQVLVIKSGTQLLMAKEMKAWHNACLVIVGDEIKYEIEGHRIFVMDSTGTRCKFELVREGTAE